MATISDNEFFKWLLANFPQYRKNIHSFDRPEDSKVPCLVYAPNSTESLEVNDASGVGNIKQIWLLQVQAGKGEEAKKIIEEVQTFLFDKIHGKAHDFGTGADGKRAMIMLASNNVIRYKDSVGFYYARNFNLTTTTI